MTPQEQLLIHENPTALQTYERMNKWFDNLASYVSAMDSGAEKVPQDGSFAAGRAAAYLEIAATLRRQLRGFARVGQ